MTRPAADSVKVEWSGTGTGTMSLGSNVAGFQSFPAALNGFRVSYEIAHPNGIERENGVGTYTSTGNTLSRQLVTFSTNSNNLVNFSAGLKTVTLTFLSVDGIENRETTNPTSGDDRDDGHIAGRSRWLNTSTDALFFCTDDAPGAAVWIQLGVGSAGALGDLTDVGTATPTNRHLIQANGTTWEGVLASLITGDFRGAGNETLAAAFAAIVAAGDAVPATDPNVTGATYTLDAAYQLYLNRDVQSTQASQRFNVPSATAARRRWLIYPKHDGVRVGVVGDAGSVNGTAGGTALGVNGGVLVVEVDSNSGSAPVVLVRGDAIIPATDVGGTKTYDNDDANQDFRLTTTSTQTISASSGYQAGFYCNIFATTGTTTIDGVDADYSAVAPDAVLIIKLGTAMWAVGKAGAVVLDAA